jgi:hypothetical protein
MKGSFRRLFDRGPKAGLREKEGCCLASKRKDEPGLKKPVLLLFFADFFCLLFLLKFWGQEGEHKSLQKFTKQVLKRLSQNNFKGLQIFCFSPN